MALLVALGAGWWGPASGTTFEGSPDGPQIDVSPSDNLPAAGAVSVLGIRFFPEGSIAGSTVQVAQCVPSLEACGPWSTFPIASDGSFAGTLPVARILALSDTSADCGVVPCEVWASGNGFATHHLAFSVTTTTASSIPVDRVPRTLPQIDVTTTPPTTPTTIPVTTPKVTLTTPTTAAPGPSTSSPPTTAKGTPTTTKTTSPLVVAGGPSTTSAPGVTTTSQPPGTTTSVPTTTTVPPPHPPSDRAPLIALTSKNKPAGPPGGGLKVQGDGYTCDTVYFFFDGIRVGSGTPDAAGHASRDGLSVPGDAGTGRHEITSSCEPSGGLVEQTAVFQVLPASLHRPAFVTALPQPGQISLDPGRLLTSAAIAVAAIMLIAFPFELFNKTMEENYDEIRGWFGLGARGVNETKTRSRGLSFFALTLVTAIVCGFLSPDFGFNETSVVLVVGMFVALLVMALVFSLPADIGIHRQFGEWGKLNYLPGSLGVSIVLVLASRVFHFQPGYFYGALAGLAFRSALSEEVQGKMTAANWLLSLMVSVSAWFLRVPVSANAARPGASIWWIGLEACLAMIFLWGVEGLAVAMLPLRFLDGRKVFRWNRVAWSVLFFLGLFATFQVLLAPGSGYVGSTTGTVAIGVMVLYAAFGAGSVAFWAYFRYRPQHWAAARS